MGNKINFRVGPQEPPLATVEKLPWFRCVTRHSRLSRTILRGTLEGRRYRVSRGNAGLTTSKSGHPFPCQNCSQWPPAEKTGGGTLLNCPSCPSDDPIGQGTELNKQPHTGRGRGHLRTSKQRRMSSVELYPTSSAPGITLIG